MYRSGGRCKLLTSTAGCILRPYRRADSGAGYGLMVKRARLSKGGNGFKTPLVSGYIFLCVCLLSRGLCMFIIGPCSQTQNCSLPSPFWWVHDYHCHIQCGQRGGGVLVCLILGLGFHTARILTSAGWYDACWGGGGEGGGVMGYKNNINRFVRSAFVITLFYYILLFFICV